jgi:hypothetical protein
MVVAVEVKGNEVKGNRRTRVHMNARVSIYEDDWLKNHSIISMSLLIVRSLLLKQCLQ